MQRTNPRLTQGVHNRQLSRGSVTQAPQKTPEGVQTPNHQNNDSPGILASCCAWLCNSSEAPSSPSTTELTESKQHQKTPIASPLPIPSKESKQPQTPVELPILIPAKQPERTPCSPPVTTVAELTERDQVILNVLKIHLPLSDTNIPKTIVEYSRLDIPKLIADVQEHVYEFHNIIQRTTQNGNPYKPSGQALGFARHLTQNNLHQLKLILAMLDHSIRFSILRGNGENMHPERGVTLNELNTSTLQPTLQFLQRSIEAIQLENNQ